MGCHRSKPHEEQPTAEPPQEHILARLREQHSYLTQLIIKHANLGNRAITSQLSVRRGEILDHIRSMERSKTTEEVRKSRPLLGTQTPQEPI